MSVKVGDIVPNVSLYEDTPANKVQTDDLLANKKVVIFGVPGAFTPVSHEFFSLALYRYFELSFHALPSVQHIDVGDVGLQQNSSSRIRAGCPKI